jgi:hypothetical protein
MTGLRIVALLCVASIACGLACGGDDPNALPPKLPTCPRAIGSIYAPAPAKPAVVDEKPATSPEAPKKQFARVPFKASPRPASASGNAPCGGVKNPCPLQRWMRETMAPPLAAKDAPALARALEKSASLSPVASWSWRTMALDAAEAAKRGDIAEARKSCRNCHAAHKADYKERFRTRKVN